MKKSRFTVEQLVFVLKQADLSLTRRCCRTCGKIDEEGRSYNVALTQLGSEISIQVPPSSL